MKTLLLLSTALFSTLIFANPSRCEMGRVSEPNMRLASYYNSQAASSFSVNCTGKYWIRFNSRNLQDASGNSFLNNGQVKLRTRMTVSGAMDNIWNIPTEQGAGKNNYVVAVRLTERITATTPAGKYRDTVFVNMVF
ncbi:hypothetical protein KTH33_00980 [Acinetobacter johnsonii]|uniref:hypothetical protein n=1 Tax=Acinetobacter johnsonii TaxID=40214 RepID=UPI0021CD5D14|nr:hypothetical protein [Acinetobacter johnsonii]MCU4325192.1 hypothetical protein [Acinetobacter johnsonii]